MWLLLIVPRTCAATGPARRDTPLLLLRYAGSRAGVGLVPMLSVRPTLRRQLRRHASRLPFAPRWPSCHCARRRARRSARRALQSLQPLRASSHGARNGRTRYPPARGRRGFFTRDGSGRVRNTTTRRLPVARRVFRLRLQERDTRRRLRRCRVTSTKTPTKGGDEMTLVQPEGVPARNRGVVSTNADGSAGRASGALMTGPTAKAGRRTKSNKLSMRPLQTSPVRLPRPTDRHSRTGATPPGSLTTAPVSRPTTS